MKPIASSAIKSLLIGRARPRFFIYIYAQTDYKVCGVAKFRLANFCCILLHKCYSKIFTELYNEFPIHSITKVLPLA